MKALFSLLDKDGYITMNKIILRALGIDATLLFGELVSEYIYYYKYHMLTEDGYFFSKSESIEENTTLSPYRQREALRILKAKKLVEVVFRGVPAKNYFTINEDVLEEFLNSDFKNFEGKPSKGSSLKNISQPDFKNFEGSLNNNSEEIILNDSCNLENKKENKQIINKSSKLTGLQALEILKPDLNSEVYETLKSFIDMRKTIKKPITGYALKLLIERLSKLSTDPEKQVEILNQSILNGWQDVFELREDRKRQGGYQQPNRYDRPAEPEEEDALTRIRKRLEAEEAARKEEEARKNEYD